MIEIEKKKKKIKKIILPTPSNGLEYLDMELRLRIIHPVNISPKSLYNLVGSCLTRCIQSVNPAKLTKSINTFT